MAEMRTFETGATRGNDEDKLDFEGFLDPTVIIRYAQYLHEHRKQADGKLRSSDNWKRGISKSVYMKSMFRHFVEVWKFHRTNESNRKAVEDSICALLFNVMGYLFELLKEKREPEKTHLPVKVYQEYVEISHGF